MSYFGSSDYQGIGFEKSRARSLKKLVFIRCVIYQIISIQWKAIRHKKDQKLAVEW